MKNNNTFSFTRFGLLFRKDIVENKNLYLLGALVIFGILVILITILGLDHADNYVPNGANRHISIDFFNFFFFFMVAFSLIFASVVFSRMNNKAKRIAEIVLPASALEKFIVKWLIVVVFYTVAYIIVFFSANYVSYLIVKLFYPQVPMIGLSINNDLSTVVAYLLLQSFYIWGGVVMPKLSFVKTSVLLFICMLVYYIYYCLLGLVVGELFYLRQAGTICDERIIYSAITVMLWILAYFRYKEETVNYKLL